MSSSPIRIALSRDDKISEWSVLISANTGDMQLEACPDATIDILFIVIVSFGALCWTAGRAELFIIYSGLCDNGNPAASEPFVNVGAAVADYLGRYPAKGQPPRLPPKSEGSWIGVEQGGDLLIVKHVQPGQIYSSMMCFNHAPTLREVRE